MSLQNLARPYVTSLCGGARPALPWRNKRSEVSPRRPLSSQERGWGVRFRLCYTPRMRFVADLHIHSHYSRATSKHLTFEHLARWAQLKGIQVVATGDIAHPGWLGEMRDALIPAEQGLFRLRDDLATAVDAALPPACRGPVRFILGGEISNIYKRDGATRKVHNLVFAPDFAALTRLQARLEKIGNIRADGRPILGLDSRDLLEIMLETGPGCCLIPAHIWTPWFSLLGSKSGFDSVEACYGDLSDHIFAVETGLSSDPPMNWRVSSLDRYALVSNSDAHSPEKLGRETTLFNTDLSYSALFDALRSRNPATFCGTVEFFPEEGKYHYDGHRACGIVWDPPTTLAHGGVCPVCGKGVTVGVMSRVETLADRPLGGQPPVPAPFASLIPLPEVLGQVYKVGAGSKQVEAEYMKLLGRLGPELTILRETPLEDIVSIGGPRLAEGIGRMRRGEVSARPGYDGEYGVISVFSGAAAHTTPGQIGLFGDEPEPQSASGATPPQTGLFDVLPDDAPPADTAASATAPTLTEASTTLAGAPSSIQTPASELPVTAAKTNDLAPAADDDALLAGLNEAQRAAVLCIDRPLVIVAGPGAGKTRTLTVRIAYLIKRRGVSPENILAITFTNKAAAEMAERLAGLLGPDVAGRITIQTFHAFGASLLRRHAAAIGLDAAFALCIDEDRERILAAVQPDLSAADITAQLAQISAAKNQLLSPTSPELADDLCAVFAAYEAALLAAHALDFDDLIAQAVRLLETQSAIMAAVRDRYRWISVDEYQDVNLAQSRMLRLMAESGETYVNLCVIGDPDQAIYGFRGADRRHFLTFEADYPGALTLRLNQNYRSTQTILDAAVQVINRQSDEAAAATVLQAVATLADFAEQVRLDVYIAPTDRAEAEYVVHQIEQMVGGVSYFSLDSGRVAGDVPLARDFGDFAVLYRLGAQSRLLVEAFARSGIPFQTAGETPLYAQKIVREALAYLWLLQNPADRVHLEIILSTGSPAGKPIFPPAAVGRIHAALSTRTVAPNANPTLASALAGSAASGDFTTAQSARLHALAMLYASLMSSNTTTSPSVAVWLEQIAEFMLAQRTVPLPDADVERLRELALRAAVYDDRLSDFLEAAALGTDADFYDPRAGRVSLMTLHAAKGLEFPVVFIVGCEEGLLPYERPNSAGDVDEERRLFYVGMTRAQQKLVLINARTRFLYGRRLENPPSRFVNDIEAALKEVQTIQRRPPPKPESTQLSLF
jgi:DNA helicase II / ATP-dependent DNA helicase PcrA